MVRGKYARNTLDLEMLDTVEIWLFFVQLGTLESFSAECKFFRAEPFSEGANSDTFGKSAYTYIASNQVLPLLKRLGFKKFALG